MPSPNNAKEGASQMSWRSWAWFYLICAGVGILTGFLGGYFQFFLHQLNTMRSAVSAWAQTTDPFTGFASIMVFCVLVAAIARFLVHYSPTAGGSGIQYVEAYWYNEVKATPFSVIPVKFFGGLLTLGSGMALGREGPTVQMGAAVGATIGRWLKVPAAQFKTLVMAAAGTGLGVAFSAPLGGAMFTFEEVTKDVSARMVLPTLVCVVFGCTVSMTILGQQPDYTVISRAFTIATPIELFSFALFGLFLGGMGVLYNKMVLAFIDLNHLDAKLLPEIKAGVVGIVVAAIVYLRPELSGGGDELANLMLNYAFPIELIVLYGLVRWVFAPLCYSTDVPGGLFSPLLLMGGILGQLFVWVINLSGLGLNPMAFCAVGMAAFFAATIRAPFTGVLLILEMTACWDLAMPMAIASAMAYTTAMLLKDMPIYTALRLRIPAVAAIEKDEVGVQTPTNDKS